ncbi:hypothetical protein [Saccharolobus islandicus]|uniref:hypothetical protein n=1 Tax=Saccharolobus islandicus TaxID=43080 RepID=UPI001FCB67B9|nr:hypothetical protein [Sulfolobus islandicus]
MQECYKVRNSEGFLVDSCTGEVVDFDNYDVTDYSNLEYYEMISSKRETKRKETYDMKKVVLNYLLSIMNENEKEEFFKIFSKLGERKDPALYLAIYEYIITKEGKVVTRDYVKFLKMKGLGRYAIRQKKKLLRKMLKEDPVLEYINNEYSGNKEEALKIYEILKKKNLIYGRAETRKRILLEYLNDSRKKKLLEEYYVENLIRWNFNNVITFQLI